MCLDEFKELSFPLHPLSWCLIVETTEFPSILVVINSQQLLLESFGGIEDRPGEIL